jgi:hypothetical protein
VAPARRALDRIGGVQHELAATVECLAAHARRVVAHALLVLDDPSAASLVGHQAHSGAPSCSCPDHQPRNLFTSCSWAAAGGSLLFRACSLPLPSSPSSWAGLLPVAIAFARSSGRTGSSSNPSPDQAGGVFIRACRRCQHFPGHVGRGGGQPARGNSGWLTCRAGRYG